MYTYIIVDDEALIRKGTRKKIEKMNDAPTCVGEASNGRAALDLIKLKQPDFIITDMDMPIMDGTALLDTLVTEYPELKIIVISGYENFNYAQKALQAKAVNYLLKPFGKEEISQIILETMNLLASEERKLALSSSLELDFLSHYLIGNSTINKIPKHLSLQLSNRFFTIMTVVDLSLKGFEYLKNTITYVIPHPQIQNLTLVVTDLEQDIQTISLELNQLSPKSLIGISNNHHTIESLADGYKETIKALNNSPLSSQKKSFSYSLSLPSKGFHHAKTDELIFLIESGQSKALIKLIDNIFKEIHDNQNLTFADIKDYGLSLIEQTKSILNDYYKTQSNLTLPQVYETIYQSMFSVDELHVFFSDFLENISIGLAYENIYGSEDVIENVQLYIDKYYYKNIQLDFLADIFFINSSYLSTLFKERSSLKFTDYLNKVRLTQAKALLLNSNRKIYQISQAVGYDNHKYFFRVFKKETGLTPEQYKLSKRRATDD